MLAIYEHIIHFALPGVIYQIVHCAFICHGSSAVHRFPLIRFSHDIALDPGSPFDGPLSDLARFLFSFRPGGRLVGRPAEGRGRNSGSGNPLTHPLMPLLFAPPPPRAPSACTLL